PRRSTGRAPRCRPLCQRRDGADSSSALLVPSMIIEKIDLISVAVLETEDDTPIGPYRDRLAPLQIARQLVQTKARSVQFFDRRRLFECSEYGAIRSTRLAASLLRSSAS